MANAGAYDYDLFVIGGGSGGVRAARIAAGYGAKVAVAEEYRLGGTCVIRGCVPKKLLVYASRFSEDFADAAGFGWTVGTPSFDWKSLIANKDKEIDRLEAAYGKTLANAKVEVLRTRAVLEGPHRINLVSQDRTVTARNILIATGARPFVDTHVPGCDLAITSNEVFHLAAQPKRIIIVGGGYIAVEFAGIFHGLGSAVMLLYRGEEILRGFDDDLRAALHKEYAAKGMDVRVKTSIARVDRLPAGGLRVILDDGSAIEADQVMAATGRVPNTAGLGLEHTAVALDTHGAVVVDDFSMTAEPTIHAVGDVTNRLNLTPVAIREGHAYADTVFGGKPTRTDHHDVPSAVFSTPEIGTVGLSEAEARKRGAVDIYKTSFRPMKATLSGRSERILMKLVVDAASERVLGVHILGPDAGEMAQLAGIAVKMGATKAQFDATVAVHPTAAEELVTMRTKWTGS